MCSVRTCGTYEKCYIRTYVSHENLMLLEQNDVTYDNIICPNLGYSRKYDAFVRTYVTYENVKCPNTCYTRIQDVLCPNLGYIQKYTMSENVLHTKI